MEPWMIEKIEQEETQQPLQIPLYYYEAPTEILNTPDEEENRGVCIIEY